MQRIRGTRSSVRQAPRRVAGGCLLVLHLITATSLAPAFTALLAASDPNHQVALQPTDHGLQIRLHHDCPGSALHRHGVVARALTAFARRTTAPQQDHLIEFGSTDALDRAPATALRGESPSCTDAALVLVSDMRFPRTDPALSTISFPRPPPAMSGLLLSLRSTVLVL